LNFKKSLLIGSLFFLATSSSFAAFVTTVKGKKALINMDGDTAEENDEFFLIDPATNKKMAIVRIKQIKGAKALVDILKGRAAPNYTLQAKASSTRPMSADVTDPAAAGGEHGADSAESPKAQGGFLTMLKESYGITGSYNMNSMTANVSYREPLGTLLKSTTSMSGSGFGVGGFYDYPFGDSFAGRVFTGLEQFVVKGSADNNACSGSTNCDADITYLSAYGLAKWYFLPGKYRSWAGGGAGFMLALAKSSSALNESQISTNQVFTAAVGTDIQMSRQNYVPLSLEYNMFPDSSTVKASMIILKAGWAWNL
jgi:hypothetical protein